MALTEHVALFSLTYFVDLYHPARGESGARCCSRTRVPSDRPPGATRSSARCLADSPNRCSTTIGSQSTWVAREGGLCLDVAGLVPSVPRGDWRLVACASPI